MHFLIFFSIFTLVGTLALFVPRNLIYRHFHQQGKGGIWDLIEGSIKYSSFIVCFLILVEIIRENLDIFTFYDFSGLEAKEGTLAALFFISQAATFHLWTFVVPAHLANNDLANATLARKSDLYFINILFGLVLSSSDNLLYRGIRWALGLH